MSAATASVRVLLAPAVGAVGGGHLVRSAALAHALAERGADVAFAIPSEAARVLARIAPALRTAIVDAPVAAAVPSFAPDILVLDDYALGAVAERPLKAHCRLLAVIDDLADRPHLADLLVDPGYGRRAGDYAALAPGAEVLAGPRFALLRPDFARLRPPAPRRRRDGPERVFVSFGLADPGGITAEAVALLRPLAPEAVFEVALGSGGASLPALRARDDIRLHVESDAVAELMAAADIAVGAGGSTVWERACLGLPSVIVALADNQRPMVRRLAAEGLTLAVDTAAPKWREALIEHFETLRQPAVSERFSAAGLALCDGLGAARVAAALLARLSRG